MCNQTLIRVHSPCSHEVCSFHWRGVSKCDWWLAHVQSCVGVVRAHSSQCVSCAMHAVEHASHAALPMAHTDKNVSDVSLVVW